MWAGWKQKGISFCVELRSESDPITPLQRSLWAALQRNILFQTFLCSTDEPAFPFQLPVILFYLPVGMHINRFWQPLDQAFPEGPRALRVFCLTTGLFPSWVKSEALWGCVRPCPWGILQPSVHSLSPSKWRGAQKLLRASKAPSERVWPCSSCDLTKSYVARHVCRSGPSSQELSSYLE